MEHSHRERYNDSLKKVNLRDNYEGRSKQVLERREKII